MRTYNGAGDVTWILRKGVGEGLWRKVEKVRGGIGRKNIPDRRNTRAKSVWQEPLGQVRKRTGQVQTRFWCHIKRLQDLS